MENSVEVPNAYVLIAAAFMVGPLLAVVFTAAITYVMGRRREDAAIKAATEVAAEVQEVAIKEAAKVQQIAIGEAVKIKQVTAEEAVKVKQSALEEAAKVKQALEIESEKQHGILEEIRRLLNGRYEVVLAQQTEALDRQREALTLIGELKCEIVNLRGDLTLKPIDEVKGGPDGTDTSGSGK